MGRNGKGGSFRPLPSGRGLKDMHGLDACKGGGGTYGGGVTYVSVAMMNGHLWECCDSDSVTISCLFMPTDG